MNKRNAIRSITLSAVIAAVYAALTMTLPMLSYGPVQLRFSEALTVLPFFLPEAVPGLFLGCVIANLFSPFGIKLKNPWLAPLPPVISNTVIIGAEIAWFETSFGPGFAASWAWNGFTVGIGELGACYVLGMLLLYLLPKIPGVRRFLSEEQLSRLPGQSKEDDPKSVS